MGRLTRGGILLFEGQIVLERLTKEKAEHGSQFVNLLSTTEIPFLFRKVLTRKCRHASSFPIHCCHFSIAPRTQLRDSQQQLLHEAFRFDHAYPSLLLSLSGP